MPSVEKTLPYPLPPETSRVFGVALNDAVKSSVDSMEELHDSLTPCVMFLRDAGIGPAQMILSIKACARESAIRQRDSGDEFALANTNILMEQIVKWAIMDFYRTV